jgi:hypothetical protein
MLRSTALDQLGSTELAVVAGGGDAATRTKLLGSHLEDERCAAFTVELRVRVLATGVATYPDLAVICGRPELDPADPTQHTTTNPRVLVEVLGAPGTSQLHDLARGDLAELAAERAQLGVGDSTRPQVPGEELPEFLLLLAK